NGLDAEGKTNLEAFLLTQLHKDSEFADVAYFIFLALHRMGRTIDALQTARTFLSGDNVFGYSNLIYWELCLHWSPTNTFRLRPAFIKVCWMCCREIRNMTSGCARRSIWLKYSKLIGDS